MEINNINVRRDLTVKNAWNQCLHCQHLYFKAAQDFVRHLREKHCSVEGGSFVCLYGYNSVCSSLPVDGVSDSDYADHVLKHHTFPQLISENREDYENINRKLSVTSQHSNSLDPSTQWTMLSASQNLAAILNDPNKGKQKDFFTKLWGVDFVEKSPEEIPKHPYLPEINHSHFESYLKKISKRYRRHVKINEEVKAGKCPSNDILHLFPKLRLQRSLSVERKFLESPDIPSIFLQSDFDMSKPETFYTVFPFAKDDKPGGSSFQQNGKLLQEKLTHDLDRVEVLIAEQVAQKSDAFFQAMTSYDSLMYQLAKTLSVVKSLREQIAIIDKGLVKQSFHILKLYWRKCNCLLVLQKLKLMSSVHQTQPTIQSLLSIPDYVASLELISATQELLSLELQGIHSFRHLSSQLNEIIRLIDKMMNNEFENYCTKDLNRPYNDDNQILEKDKLISLILGMLKRKNMNFILKYKQEAFTTIKTIVKQVVLEALAENDCDADGPYTIEQAQTLDLNKWIDLMKTVTTGLIKLLQRIKAVHDVMKTTAILAAGRTDSSQKNDALECNNEMAEFNHLHLDESFISEDIDSEYKKSEVDGFLNEKEFFKINEELKELLVSVCDFSHDECAKLLTTLAKSKSIKDKTVKQNEKSISNGYPSMFETVDAKKIFTLSRIIENFTMECEKISSKSPTSLKAAFQVQANKFMNKFHNDRKEKLTMILEKECWRPSEVRSNYQTFIDDLLQMKSIARYDFESLSEGKTENFLSINNEKFIIVGATLFLIQIITEYTSLAEDLSALTLNILRNLVELLSHFNSKSSQLVLGAGAMQTAGLKTITTTNLVLASRSLQLIIWLLPYIRTYFTDIINRTNSDNLENNSNILKNLNCADLNKVEANMKDHISKLNEKVITIVSNVISIEISNWGAKPPVPSVSFRGISKHLSKLYKAVAEVLPQNQIEELYKSVHNSFKASLREQLKKLNIVNNGGPQHGTCKILLDCRRTFTLFYPFLLPLRYLEFFCFRTVTSELIFYMEMLKKLQVFKSEDLTENSLEDIWLTT